MQQFPRQDTWTLHVTECVQEMDKSSTAGFPLPWCPNPCEDVLRRRFHLQDVHCTKFTKGIKRGQQDSTAEGTGVIANCKRERRTVDQDGLSPADASSPTVRYEFVDETVETTKSQASGPIPWRERGKRRTKQKTSRPSSVVPHGDSPLPFATCLPSVEDHLPLSTSLTDVSSEASENLSDPGLIWSATSVSQSSSPASSQDIETPRDGDEGDEIELTSLSSLLKIGPSSSPPGFRSKTTQEGLAEPILQVQGRTEVSGPYGTSTSLELSDHDSDIQILGVNDVREEWQLVPSSVQNGFVVTPDAASDATSTSKHSVSSTYKCPCCGAGVPPPPRHQRNGMDARHRRAFCEAHKLKDKLKAAESEWARRGYPRIGWRRLDARMRKFLPALHSILNGETPSPYLSQLKSAVASRVNPKTRCMDNATAGYYGPRGQQVM
jgi:hypothetical protein